MTGGGLRVVVAAVEGVHHWVGLTGAWVVTSETPGGRGIEVADGGEPEPDWQLASFGQVHLCKRG